MDEMKYNHGIDDALRDLAQERDRRLRSVPKLTPARLALLTEFLREQFPLESAIRQAGIQRDRLLNLPSGIPAPVELTLQKQLVARIATRNTVRKSWSGILQKLIRSPFAAALTVCVMITVAAFFYGPAKTQSRRNARNLKPDKASFDSRVVEDRWLLGRAELFNRKASIRPFDLNKTEPASLQASFFTNSGMYFADEGDARLGLRLDLPVKALLTEQVLARTP